MPDGQFREFGGVFYWEFHGHGFHEAGNRFVLDHCNAVSGLQRFDGAAEWVELDGLGRVTGGERSQKEEQSTGHCKPVGRNDSTW